MVDPIELPLAEFTTDQLIQGVNKDPINLIFIGNLAQPAEVRRIVMEDLELGHDKGLSDQYFGEPDDPIVRHRQDFNQSNHFISGLWSRIHTRVYAVLTPHPDFGRFIAAPIHKDHWVICAPVVNDAAESYDAGRKWATNRLWRRFDVAVVPAPPFEAILQCNGDATSSDGFCAVVAERDVLSDLGYRVLTRPES